MDKFKCMAMKELPIKNRCKIWLADSLFRYYIVEKNVK